MAVWLVRAGKRGEWEELALKQGVSVIGWSDLPDLSRIGSQEELRSLCEKTYPDATPARISNFVGQLWSFRERIQTGDLIALPLKSQAAIAIGKVTGPYQYRTDLPGGPFHTRPVTWIRTDIPRSAFDQDLLYSLGAFMTVCRIERNNAEARIQALLQGQAPLPPEPEQEAVADIEQYARDQIVAYISRRFKGHDLARLVNEVLRARGYHTQLSPSGPDGGVDIIAGRGAMGFDPPRACVQVKSGDAPVDVGVLRELQGVMKNFRAEQGLLVSWGGFKSSVIAEARRLFFEIRLWDAGDLVRAVLEDYERMSPELQAELPLKRIWALVSEEEE